MSETTKLYDIMDGIVQVQHTFGNHRVHYTLNAAMVNVDDILLKLMERHSGACMLPIEQQLAEPCDSYCENCEKSIFYYAALEQQKYRTMANNLLERIIKQGDQWEVSYVFTGGEYTNHTFLFTCKKTIPSAPTILEITSKVLTEHTIDVIHGVKAHYFKIQRFDMDDAVDCSSSGHWRLIDKIKSAK